MMFTFPLHRGFFFSFTETLETLRNILHLTQGKNKTEQNPEAHNVSNVNKMLTL